MIPCTRNTSSDTHTAPIQYHMKLWWGHFIASVLYFFFQNTHALWQCCHSINSSTQYVEIHTPEIKIEWSKSLIKTEDELEITVIIKYLWEVSSEACRRVCPCRDHFVYGPNPWETMLHCNIISYWLGTYTERSLYMFVACKESRIIPIHSVMHWELCLWSSNYWHYHMNWGLHHDRTRR